MFRGMNDAVQQGASYCMFVSHTRFYTTVHTTIQVYHIFISPFFHICQAIQK